MVSPIRFFPMLSKCTLTAYLITIIFGLLKLVIVLKVEPYEKILPTPHCSCFGFGVNKIRKRNLYCTHGFTPKRVTNGVARRWWLRSANQGWRSRDKSRSRDLNFKISVSRLGEKFGSRSRSNWISVSKQMLRLESSFIGTVF